MLEFWRLWLALSYSAAIAASPRRAYVSSVQQGWTVLLAFVWISFWEEGKENHASRQAVRWWVFWTSKNILGLAKRREEAERSLVATRLDQPASLYHRTMALAKACRSVLNP